MGEVMERYMFVAIEEETQEGVVFYCDEEGPMVARGVQDMMGALESLKEEFPQDRIAVMKLVQVMPHTEWAARLMEE